MSPSDNRGSPDQPFAEEATVTIRDLGLALWPHRWLIILFATAGLLVAAAYTVMQPTVYLSRATFVVARYNPVSQATGSQLQTTGRFLGAFYDPANQKELVAEIFQSRRFIRSAVPEIYEEGVADTDALVDRIAGRLSVSFDEESPHLTVTYSSTNPQEPAQVLAALLGTFPSHLARQIRTNLETSLETAERLLAQETFSRGKRQELRQRVQEIRHALIVEEVTGEKFSISVIESPGLIPRKTSIVTASGLGLAIGLILGILVALALETWDTRLHTSEEIEEQTGLQVLGTIPRHGADEGESPDIRDDPRSPFAESIRLLRANLKFKDVDAPSRTLLVTSPLEGEGKSTIARNLALSYTLEGTRTLLADFDLRRGKIHTSMGCDRSPGLSSLLVEDCSLDEAVSTVDDLSVLPTGELPPNPAELLASSRLEEVLETLRERYERVILDGTPILGLADMIELSQRVDSVLIVFRAEQTHANPATDALEDLAEVGASVTGAVFNSIPADGRAYYSGYRYYYDSYDYTAGETSRT